MMGGCESTQYGCCKDNVTSSNVNGTNCYTTNVTMMGGCESTQFGCCKDNVTSCSEHCLNCPVIY